MWKDARKTLAKRDCLGFPPCQWDAICKNSWDKTCVSCGRSLRLVLAQVAAVFVFSVVADLYLCFSTYQAFVVYTHASTLASHFIIAFAVCAMYSKILLTLRLHNLYTAYVTHDCFTRTLADGRSVTWIVAKPGAGILYSKTFSILGNED